MADPDSLRWPMEQAYTLRQICSLFIAIDLSVSCHEINIPLSRDRSTLRA